MKAQETELQRFQRQALPETFLRDAGTKTMMFMADAVSILDILNGSTNPPKSLLLENGAVAAQVLEKKDFFNKIGKKLGLTEIERDRAAIEAWNVAAKRWNLLGGNNG